jgi:hypothetical protein
MKYPDKQSVVKELFGDKRITTRIELPGNLNDLVTALPPEGYYTVDRLIDNHRLLPFYSPFFPPELINLIREEMRGSNKQHSYGRLGLVAGHIQMFIYLRFCPLCVQEDRKQFGECYWHRLHQVPGVEVCPTHQVAVMNSGVLKRNRSSSKYDFISAEQAIRDTKPYQLNLSVGDQENLLKISRDANWLLNQNNLFLSNDYLEEFYFKNLYELGLCTFRGKIHINKVVEAFKNHYSPTILKLLQCEVNDLSRNHWLIAIFHKKSRIRHPLRHLLAINFLGYTAEEVSKLSIKFKPFGDGSWPCLNPVCQHFEQLVIKECHITPNPKRSSDPIGTFQCICGYTYSRKGPDTCAKDQFRKSPHKTIYGPLWESTLVRLWDDEAISLNQIARRLGVQGINLKRQAALLELAFPRVGSENFTQLTSNLLYYRSTSNPETKRNNSLETYQKKLLEARQQNPLLTRSKLKERCPTAYDWLQKNCPDWLETHLPPPISAKGKRLPSSEVDWEKRDIELAAVVKASALRITSNSEYPVRVTRTSIGRDTNKLQQLQTQLDKLPLAAKALAEVVETHEEFAVRKIEEAVKSFLEEKVCPKPWQFLRRASVSPGIASAPQVEKAIDAALKSLASIDASSGANKSSANDFGTLHEV